MVNMKKVPTIAAEAKSWDQIHPTLVPNSLIYVNDNGEAVFLAGDVIESPNVARILETPAEVN